MKALGAGAVTSLAGCLGTLGRNDTYEIGSVVSESGDLEVYGERHNRGMDLALGRINEEGVGGGEIEVIREDTAGASETGKSAAETLVEEEGVPLFIGAVSSGVTTSIAQSVTVPNDVVQISPHSTSPKITGLNDKGFVLRSAPSDAFQGAAMARLGLERGIETASVVLINNDYGQGFADVLVQTFQNGGGRITQRVPYNSDESSYESELESAMAGDPDAIMFVAYPESFKTMARQAHEMGIDDEVEYIGAESTLADTIKEEVRSEALEGMIGTTPSAPTESDRWQTYVSDFQNEYGQEPTVWSAYSYDATAVAALSIQASETFEGPALRDAVYDPTRPPGKKVESFAAAKEALEAGKDVNYQGVSGKLDLDENGDVPGTYKWWTFTDGDYQVQGFLDL